MKNLNIFPIPPGLEPSQYDSVIWITESNYASVYCLGNGMAKLVVKKMKQSDQINMKYEDLLTINKITLYYRDQLSRVGVPVPEYYYTSVENGENWHFCSYIGDDYSNVTEESIKFTLVKVVSSLAGFLSQIEWLVGIDPRLSNFAGDNQAVYVDFFPPLCIFNGQSYVHFPNPTDEVIIKKELQRKFTAEGVVRRLRFDVMTHNPDWAITLNQIIESELPPGLSSKLLKYIDALPDNLLISSKSEAEQLIDKYCELQMNDELREIALRLIPKGDNRESLLNDIFHLTSNFHSRPQYPVNYEDRIYLFKKIIKKYL